MENKRKDEIEKCFVMMPISDQGDYPEGHFQKVYEQIFRPAIESAGYQPYRVDENAISDQIIDKIFCAIQECPMALCDLSNRNPNVLYELGLRQAYDKPVVLVQDEKTDKIFDVSGISTVFYKSDRIFEHVIEARERITKAIKETRDGTRKSIVKIIKAQTAKISTEDITKEDKIEIMLAGIIEDLKTIKLQNRNNREISGNSQGVISINGGIAHNAIDFNKMRTLKLRRGVSKNEINHAIANVEEKYMATVECEIEGNILRFTCHGSPELIVDSIESDLAKKIGI